MGIPLMFALKDVILKQSAPKVLLVQQHADFILSYEKKKDEYEYVMSEFLRMSGLYWCLTAMDIMGQLHKINKAEVIDFVRQCWRESGGFAASIDNDAHLLHTLSAIQILATLGRLDVIDKERVMMYIQQRQNEDGSFSGDEWGEVDTRFSFCAIAALALLNRLDAIDLDKAVDYVLRCKNFDGGFGSVTGSESHAGQIYCCLGTLSIANELNRLNADQLGWWLCERQCTSGGLNGRPEKLPDVCYSWWVLASLSIIGRKEWIDKTRLTSFILACQDEETGGFADRPGDMPDPFHTLFGLGGLSLLGDSSLKRVNPVLCMTEERLRSCGVKLQYLYV
ncbi:unnamed protein product [Soboliphyme baturini]|uniref:Geranylgeranyl transferase type-2 subunit beta n=1 Tax=Soboliphyme baturini TaxID=241478 RepID=A0A183IBT9_9BILA|nr:unnamed protein product [Soboliphyme baturini]